VDEYIIAPILGNKSKPFFLIEPFNSTFRHWFSPPFFFALIRCNSLGRVQQESRVSFKSHAACFIPNQNSLQLIPLKYPFFSPLSRSGANIFLMPTRVCLQVISEAG
jgi:hypothetical protein